jgi:flagellar biosynthesis/type III secretory pathway M-ring protein FliF/YscJ
VTDELVQQSQKESGLSGVEIFGVIVACFLGVALVSLVAIRIRKRRAVGEKEFDSQHANGNIAPKDTVNGATEENGVHSVDPVLDMGKEKDLDEDELENVEII